MSYFTKLLFRLRRDRRGATIVEFAFVAPVFIVMIMAGLDIAYQAYLRSVISGTVEGVARRSAVGGMTTDDVDDAIIETVNAVLPINAQTDPDTITITKKSFSDFSSVGNPEKITNDIAPLGSYNVGDCYEDANGNNQFDASGGSNGIGGADEIVYYQVDVAFPRLFPMAGLLNWDPMVRATAKTVVRNQPYGAQAVPPVRCN